MLAKNFKTITKSILSIFTGIFYPGYNSKEKLEHSIKVRREFRKMVMNLITLENLTRMETCVGLVRKYTPEILQETISIHTHG